jgi:hypothetical protein
MVSNLYQNVFLLAQLKLVDLEINAEELQQILERQL